MMSDRWSGFASCSSAHRQSCQWQMLQQQIKRKRRRCSEHALAREQARLT